MAKIVAISDLHLGDRDEADGTVLSFPSVCKNFANQLAEITGGVIETLVINGDCFEACVPTRTVEENFLHKTSVFDLYNSTIEDAQRFFSTLTSSIKINHLVWVPGNHDFTLYMHMRKLGIVSGPTTSPYSGYPLRKAGIWSSSSGGVLSKLFGSNIMDITVAYPNFVYKMDGQDMPFALFTHGHLFDPQVLNPSKDFLSALGLLAETGHIFDPIYFDADPGKWMETLVEMSSDRIMKIWTQNLDLVKEAVYNYAQRRKIYVICGERPKVPGTHVWLAALAGLNVTEHHVWYCNGFIQDMSPVYPSPCPTSYFVVGHTHFGGANTFEAMDHAPFQVYDLGGWTVDGAGHKDNVPHTHVLAWDSFPATPKMYALNVGRP